MDPIRIFRALTKLSIFPEDCQPNTTRVHKASMTALGENSFTKLNPLWLLMVTVLTEGFSSGLDLFSFWITQQDELPGHRSLAEHFVGSGGLNQRDSLSNHRLDFFIC